MLRLIILNIAFLCALPLTAQSWDALNSLKAGEQVKVRDTSGKEYSAVFASVTPTGIALTTRNGPVTVERALVRRVQVRSASRRVRKVLMAAGIGAIVGAVVDHTIGAYLRNETGESGGRRAITYITPMALFGGIAAAVPGYRTAYQAP